MTWQFPKHNEAGKIQCPHCGSPNWRCWDERMDGGQAGQVDAWGDPIHDAFDDDIERCVGYMACKDCGGQWLDENPPYPLPAGYFDEEAN